MTLSPKVALAAIPQLTGIGLAAWVSAYRIENYLNGSEQIDFCESSDHIELESASFTWPLDSPDASRFMLKNVNVRFPNDELSIISGKTGSGKSLLLASITGEVDKLAGIIKVPRPPLFHNGSNYEAAQGKWIINNSMAFVAQVPWIENTTIKDNILFGLPYDNIRYKKTLEVCALLPDLDMLPDGDLTDIGVNGQVTLYLCVLCIPFDIY